MQQQLYFGAGASIRKSAEQSFTEMSSHQSKRSASFEAQPDSNDALDYSSNTINRNFLKMVGEVRTHLDLFSDVECSAIICSAYAAAKRKIILLENEFNKTESQQDEEKNTITQEQPQRFWCPERLAEMSLSKGMNIMPSRG